MGDFDASQIGSFALAAVGVLALAGMAYAAYRWSRSAAPQVDVQPTADHPIAMVPPIDDQYSDDSFWGKLKAFALTAGREIVEKALTLYYVLQKPELPAWARTTVIGALGYFISPIDAIPDFTPIVGYADDLGVVAMALGAVAVYVDEDVRAAVAKKLRDWFGE